MKKYISNYSPIRQGGHTGPPLRINNRVVGADLCVRPGLKKINNDKIEIHPLNAFWIYALALDE